MRLLDGERHMHYRSIRAAAHNFVHSFMSWPNQVEGQPVCEELYRIVRERVSEPVVIDWLDQNGGEECALTPRVLRSVDAYREMLPEFLRRHGVSRDALLEFSAEIYLDMAHQIHVGARLVDDRGKTHVLIVQV
jgi:hypothetical protein